MKMRSILLSVLAIAVLASCAKDDGLGSGDNGDASEAKVTLRLKGNGSPSSRAAGPVVGNDEAINTLTVFFLNASDGVIGTPLWINSTGTPTTNLATTTDARRVVVIANLGTDQTGVGGLFQGVSTLSQIQGKLGDLISGGAATQSSGNVYMSGVGVLSPFTLEGTVQKATVSVTLNFVSARIQIMSIEWNGGNAAAGAVTDNVYAAKDGFAGNGAANFTIERVYLMNVQTKTRFLPNTINWTVSPPTLGSDYITKAARSFAGGVAWEGPWAGEDPLAPAPAPAGFVQNDEYLLDSMPAVDAATGNKLATPGYWHVFANNTDVTTTADYPTALVIETKWRSVAGSTTEGDLLTRYFTVYFGGGDQEAIAAGNDYQVTLKLNGSFKPADDGGDGGGGTDDPTTPTVNSVVDITVTVKPWETKPIDKEWN